MSRGKRGKKRKPNERSDHMNNNVMVAMGTAVEALFGKDADDEDVDEKDPKKKKKNKKAAFLKFLKKKGK